MSTYIYILTVSVVFLLTSGCFATNYTYTCPNGKVIVPISAVMLNNPLHSCVQYLKSQIRSIACWGQTTCTLTLPKSNICGNGSIDFSYDCISVENIFDICSSKKISNVNISDVFYITSPRYPINYVKSQYCLNFKLPTLTDGKTYQVKLIDMQLDYIKNRCNDRFSFIFIEVYKGEPPISHKFCGDIDSGLNIEMPANNSFTSRGGILKFISDDFDNKKRGFLLRLQVIEQGSQNDFTTVTPNKIVDNTFERQTLSTLKREYTTSSHLVASTSQTEGEITTNAPTTIETPKTTKETSSANSLSITVVTFIFLLLAILL